MKKYIITLIIALGFGLNLSAQKSDGFFSNGNYSEYREDSWVADMPLLPTSHGYGYDYDANAPLGTGLLLLGGMAIGYAALRKRK